MEVDGQMLFVKQEIYLQAKKKKQKKKQKINKNYKKI